MTEEKPKIEGALRGAPILIMDKVAKLMAETWDDVVSEAAKALKKGRGYRVTFEFEFKRDGDEVGMKSAMWEEVI